MTTLSPSQLWNKLVARRKVAVALLGLDGSGVTAILEQLFPGAVANDLRFQHLGWVEHAHTAHDAVRVWGWNCTGDYISSFQDKVSRLWLEVLQCMDALVFVVDSCDMGRLHLLRLGLHRLLEQEVLQGKPLLVFANKQDLAGAMKPGELAQELQLASLRGRTWYVQPCSGLTGEGVEAGWRWVLTCIDASRPRSAGSLIAACAAAALLCFVLLHLLSGLW